MAKNIYGVLTGDLVDYSKLDENGRIQYVNNLRAILNKLGIKDLVFEIFRGDSFQAVLPSSREALKVALIIRSYIISHKLDSKKKIKPDVRIAIGIGNIENYNENNISSSDGEAFRNSGPELDRMNKKRQRLIIKTNWSEVNKELKTECALLDALISKWTSVQTETIYYSLLDFSQNEIAEMRNVSQGNISTRLNSANFQAVKEMINRYTELIDGGVVHIFLDKMEEIDVAPGLKCLATRHPDSPVFHREYASYLSYTGNYGAAVEEYTKALDKDPEDYETRTDLIYALRETGNNVDVENECRKVLDLRDDWVPALYWLAKTYEATGNLNEAERYFRKASIYTEPDDLEPLRNLINVLSEQNKFDEAEDEINKLLNLNPGDYFALSNLYHIHMSGGNEETAINAVESGIEYLEDNIENFDDQTDVLIDLAMLYELVGRYPRAEISLSKAIKEEPENPFVHYLLARICLAKKEFVKSESEIKISLSLDPEDSNSYFVLGQILLSKEDYESAKENLEKSIHFNSQNPHAYFLLGMSEYALGNSGQAGIQFKKAHEMDLNLPEAEKILSDLNSGSFEEGEL